VTKCTALLCIVLRTLLLYSITPFFLPLTIDRVGKAETFDFRLIYRRQRSRLAWTRYRTN